MKLKTKLMLAGAFVFLMSLLAGVWALVLVGLAVIAWMAFGRWRAVSPEAKSGLGKAAELLVAAPINFAALVAHAVRDAERKESALTKKQRRKLEEILGQQAFLKDRKRERSREVERRAKERGPGLTERAYQAIKRDVEAQFAQEIRELEKQLKESKAEMKRMLSEGRPEKTPVPTG